MVWNSWPCSVKPVVKVRGNVPPPLIFSLCSYCSPPPIFSLCSSPTWIQLLSINYLLKSQWVTVNMLLVDFTTEFGVNASTDTQRSINPTYLQKVILPSTGLTSHPTHYRSYRGRVLRVKWPNQQCQFLARKEETKLYVSLGAYTTVFCLGLCPRPRWGSLQRSPRPPSCDALRLRGEEGRGGGEMEGMRSPTSSILLWPLREAE